MDMISKLSSAKEACNSMCLAKASEPHTGESGVYVGRTAIYRNPFMLDLQENVNPHMAVVGMTGSGKTYFTKSAALRAAMQCGYSLLIIDWNGEYTQVVDFIGGMHVTIGTSNRANIFDLYGPDKDGIDSAVEMLAQESKLDDSERALVESIANSAATAHTRVSLQSIIRALEGDAHPATALAGKLARLQGDALFGDSTDFDKEALLRDSVSIDLSEIKDDRQRTAVSRAVLKIAINAMRKRGVHQHGNAMIIIDEAWRMLSGSNEIFTLFREGRKYGVSVVIATQMASDINNAVIANSGCIAVFRLQSPEDYSILEKASAIGGMKISDLSSLGVGSCMLRINRKHGEVASFIVSHVDGVNMDGISIFGGKMQTYISSGKFFAAAEALGEHAKAEIGNFVIENNRRIDIAALIKLLIGCSLDRPQIVEFLHSVGIDDLSIAIAYEKAVPNDSIS
ncbi:MAG: DUF87 domain-containing protein [Candidatus Micrarchaeaceae archaeon]